VARPDKYPRSKKFRASRTLFAQKKLKGGAVKLVGASRRHDADLSAVLLAVFGAIVFRLAR